MLRKRNGSVIRASLCACVVAALPISTGCIEEAAPDLEVVLATCDEELAGVDWGDSPPTEGQPGFDDEFADVDLSIVPDPIDISSMTSIHRGYIAYALGIAPAELGASIPRATIEAEGLLGQVVLASVARDMDGALGIDFAFFRRGFHRYYTCSRAYPLTLEGFYATYGDPREIAGNTVDSAAKCTDRRLILDSANEVYVAETLVDGSVRETEIVLAGNRDDGQLDFVVYDADGQLSDRSEFPTLAGNDLVTAAPYSCMSCHMSTHVPSTLSFDLLVPETGPCAQ